MHNQVMRMARSQEALSQQDRDIAYIQRRLEDELKNITYEQSQPHPMQRCILLLMDVGTVKESLGELRERAESIDQLNIEVKAMVSRICAEYENCMNELRYRLSLTEDDLIEATTKLAATSQLQQQLTQKDNEMELLRRRIGELQLQLTHQKQQFRNKEETLSQAKASSDKEVFELNCKINEILEIVHEKNIRVDELQSELRTVRTELEFQCMQIQPVDVLALTLPIEAVSAALPKRLSIDSIDIVGVKDCGAPTTKNERHEETVLPSYREDSHRDGLLQQPMLPLPTALDNLRTTPTSQARQPLRKKSQPQLKEIDSELMNRMQVFISEMTASHRNKMKQLQRTSIIASFRSPKRTSSKQQWFGWQQRRGQPSSTVGSISARQ